MKRLLNTLFVTTDGAYLAKDGEAILVRVEKETKLRVPIHNLSGIVCFGNVSCSPFLLRMCWEKDVTVSFMSMNGRFLGRLEGPCSGNVLLRRQQYRAADSDGASTDAARFMLIGKIANCRTVIRRAARDSGDTSTESNSLARIADGLGQSVDRLGTVDGLDELRGVEGDAARLYFSGFDSLIQTRGPEFRFAKRSRRPPLDNVNAMLSFTYTLLLHDVSSALTSVGLDSAVGFLHRDRPGRPGLALDMMEELRPVLADRVVLTLINRRQIKASGFRRDETGGVTMDDDTRKTILTTWQERKRTKITHPFLDERMEIGWVPHIQARLLARMIRGELDAYPPFIWR